MFQYLREYSNQTFALKLFSKFLITYSFLSTENIIKQKLQINIEKTAHFPDPARS